MATDQNENEDSEQNGLAFEERNKNGPPIESRFSKWILMTLLSLVSGLALFTTRHRYDRSETWCLVGITLVLVFGGLGIFFYVFSRPFFAGQLIEIVFATIILIFWSATLPVLMNPANSLAIGFTDHLNANLYFSSWVSFGTCASLCGDLARDLIGWDWIGFAMPLTKMRQGKWYALVVTSAIVLTSSVRVYGAFPCSAEVLAKSSVCKQTRFAISTGVIGIAVSMMSTVLIYCTSAFSLRWRILADAVASVLMVVIWSFGLGYVTFGSGPGENIGNLYFATWGSFMLSVLLVTESYQDVASIRNRTAPESSMRNPSNSPGNVELTEESIT